MYQQGFDTGYASGFKTAFALGRQLGRNNVEDSFLTASQCQLCADATKLNLPLAEIEKIHQDRHQVVQDQLSTRYKDINKRFQSDG
jgi:flagellar biosynthesis/type III secretory pathway protein FliH